MITAEERVAEPEGKAEVMAEVATPTGGGRWRARIGHGGGAGGEGGGGDARRGLSGRKREGREAIEGKRLGRRRAFNSPLCSDGRLAAPEEPPHITQIHPKQKGALRTLLCHCSLVGPDDRVQQAIISGQNVQMPSPAATKGHSLQEVEASRPTVELQGAALGAADGAWSANSACSVRRMRVDAARERCFHHLAHQHGR